MKHDNKELNNIASTVNKLGIKLKLLNLIIKAKKEYDSYNLSSAQKNLEEALAIEKENTAVLRGLGCVHQSNKEFEIAIDYYKQSIKYSSTQEIEYTLIATAYYAQGETDEAIRYFNLAIDKNDDYTLAYEGRNQAMLENHVKLLELQEILNQYKFW